jgi:formamidopyrimidine-DNA glycosylase
MPELPDIDAYIESLKQRIIGRPLNGVRIKSPFVLRTSLPPLSEIEGKKVTNIHRVGKQIVFHLDEDFFVVLHLMIAGRLQWKPPGSAIPGRIGIAAFDFPEGTLLLTEASTKRRASIHLVRGKTSLNRFSRGGIEILEIDLNSFRTALLRENHTLKRALTDHRFFSGIGNTYSDEILHRARLSPLAHTSRLTEEEISHLFGSCRTVLTEWKERIMKETRDGFPKKVSAFREGMAVHGRYGKPCPRCGTTVQRIVYSENECNYCPTCQTGGKILADRALSRILKKDWPKTVQGLEKLSALHAKKSVRKNGGEH